MYDRKRLAMGTGVAYACLVLLVLSVLYTGTVLAYPIAGIGGFQVQAENVTAQNFYLHPGVAETSTPPGQTFTPPDQVELQPNYELFRGDYYEAGGTFSSDTCGQDTTDPTDQTCMPLYNESNRVDAGYSGLVDDISQAGDTNEFAYRFRMRINVKASGSHTFYVGSDDGARLWIDGNLVVDDPGFGDNNVSGSINLSQGWHTIHVNYFEASGGQRLNVVWNGSTTGGNTMPVDSFLAYRTITNPDYRYYENSSYGDVSGMPPFDSANFVGYGHTPNLDDITTTTRDQRMNDFAYQYLKCIDVPSNGDYTFYTTSDNGSRLYVEGQQVVNNDGLHGAQTASGTINLEAGVHVIRTTYFEYVDAQSFSVEWDGPGFNREPIPDSALSRTPCPVTTRADYPDVVLELANVQFSNLILTKEIDVSSLPGLSGTAQIRLNGGATFNTSRLLFKASAVRAEGSTFRGFVVNETQGADARTRLMAAAGPDIDAINTRSLVDLNASSTENGTEFRGVRIQAHYLAADEVPLAAVRLGVQYDPDGDGTYEYRFT
ncbi:MAG: PA14 domain-containing protein [Halorientalis sp.]